MFQKTYNGATLQPYYYHKNLQGDVIAIYDESGNIKAEYAYDAYGNCKIIRSTLWDLAQNNPIRYRGYYLDRETGFYFLNTRYYNPEWRRFISPDSTDYLDPESVNGLHLYAYCGNDPINYVDPTGHFPVLAVILGVAALIGMGLTIGGVASDNNIITAIGLTMVAVPALISGGMAIAAGVGGATLTGVVGGVTVGAGVGSGLFASAEYQEAFTGNNWMLDAGMIEGWYNGLMLTTAAIATLGTFASSFCYSFNIKSIDKIGRFSKYGQKGYRGIKFKTGNGKTRVLTFQTHSHVPGKTISQWHWQLSKWNPQSNETASTIARWIWWSLRRF